jgi:hypothetical protein
MTACPIDAIWHYFWSVDGAMGRHIDLWGNVGATSLTMTDTRAKKQDCTLSRKNPLGLYEPVSLSVHSRRRFRRARLAHFLAQLRGRQPTPEEIDIIAQLCRIGWDERVIRAEAETSADPRIRADLRRQAAELGRQQILLRRDLDRAAPSPPQPPPAPSLKEYLARKAAERQSEQGDAA